MGKMRQAAKRDTNEPEIVAALRGVGASVEMLSGRGIPDLLVGWRGENHLMEVKGAYGRLTDDQVKWHAGWRGGVFVVHTVREALHILDVD
jgi:hypothetical protein